MNHASTPAPATPAPVSPAFSDKLAKGVTPYRHEKTGRTVSLHQTEGESTHLFSATGVFIATVKKAEAAQLAAASKAAAAKQLADDKAANDAAHARVVKMAAMKPEERTAFLRAEEAQAIADAEKESAASE